MRKLADLPSQGHAVAIQLKVRCFFRAGAKCPRRIFAECVPLARVFARTTSRLSDLHAEIGFFLGDEAGARLASRLAMTTSPDTLLRRIRQTDVPNSQPVRVLGIDD